MDDSKRRQTSMVKLKICELRVVLLFCCSNKSYLFVSQTFSSVLKCYEQRHVFCLSRVTSSIDCFVM